MQDPYTPDTASMGVIAWAVISEQGEPAFGVSLEDDAGVGQFAPESARGRPRVSLFGRRGAAA